MKIILCYLQHVRRAWVTPRGKKCSAALFFLAPRQYEHYDWMQFLKVEDCLQTKSIYKELAKC